MALDTREKRASVPGVARPWMRGIYPNATKGQAWREAVGNSYARHVVKQIAADIAASGEVGADLLAKVLLDATITASGNVVATLDPSTFLDLSITANGTVTANLRRTVGVSGDISASATAVFDLTEVSLLSPWFFRTNAINKFVVLQDEVEETN